MTKLDSWGFTLSPGPVRLGAVPTLHRGMSEYQVRAHLYDPPEAVRRLDSKLACLRMQTGAHMSGEAMRRAFESRLDKRVPDVVAAPAQNGKGPRIRLIA